MVKLWRFLNNGLPLLFRNKSFDNYDQKNNPNAYIKCKVMAARCKCIKGQQLGEKIPAISDRLAIEFTEANYNKYKDKVV